MELRVLEGKIDRCINFIKKGDQHKLIQELLCVRKFDSSSRPRWLVFEFEQGIMIRPEQFDLAMHLLDNPGSISQMNMGLGKTRVSHYS
jgi:hypothetical protein